MKNQFCSFPPVWRAKLVSYIHKNKSVWCTKLYIISKIMLNSECWNAWVLSVNGEHALHICPSHQVILSMKKTLTFSPLERYRFGSWNNHIVESWNHRMACVEKEHNDHPVPTPLLCAGSPTTRPGCPEPHPAWPWMPPGMGHPQPL